jgi:hypothetical protein
LNCTKAYIDHPDLCSMTRELNVVRANRPIDGFSALSLQVNFGNDRPQMNNRLK